MVIYEGLCEEQRSQWYGQGFSLGTKALNRSREVRMRHSWKEDDKSCFKGIVFEHPGGNLQEIEIQSHQEMV